MAQRPIFLPNELGPPFVEAVLIEFAWAPGMSASQAQKSIASLHQAAAARGIAPVLEISSKSKEALGVALSAFNLQLELPERGRISVEGAFQGSKVFEGGGPYEDLYAATSRDARIDERLRTSGSLIAFRLLGEDFPTEPLTAFYDWLYLRALQQNPHLARELDRYAAFSDIVFNPQRSLNCQARAAAIYISLQRAGLLERALADRDEYLARLGG